MAKGIGTIAHSAPSEVGHVFAQTQPRHAVIYHFFNDFDTAGEMERDVRNAWQGPLSLAQDLMVFNVTKDEVLVRMAVTPNHVWPNKKEHSAFLSGPRKQRLQMSRWLADKQLFPKF